MPARPPPSLRERTSGILLHPTSLPGPHGNGDLGAEARAFAEMLQGAGQRWWQMLPVGPAGYGDSPYSALSAFAGSPLLVDLDALGIEIEPDRLPERAVDYELATRFRERHLRRAFEAHRARATPAERKRFESFRERERAWLADFALYDAIKRAHGLAPWIAWEEGVRLRKKDALARARREHADAVAFAEHVQWVFAEQWAALRAFCSERGVGLIGDVPIFVAHDSADVWQHRELFDLDEMGMPRHVAGVPPDYFSATGQRWGNPLYKWKVAAKTGYAWWVDRFRMALERFDAIRLDHFIGFVRYWRIAASEPTAMKGTWMKGPGRALFDAVRAKVTRGGPLPLIAEDLGAVTPAVTRLRRELGLPGIRLVQFAFGTDPQAPKFIPYDHVWPAVVYTGTHDNDTSAGWFYDRGGGPDSTRTEEEAEIERGRVLAYIGRENDQGIAIHWEMIRLAMASVARTCIVPMQDVLGLGAEARMNRPGQPSGNWRWRFAEGDVDIESQRRLLRFARIYGRAS